MGVVTIFTAPHNDRRIGRRNGESENIYYQITIQKFICGIRFVPFIASMITTQMSVIILETSNSICLQIDLTVCDRNIMCAKPT